VTERDLRNAAPSHEQLLEVLDTNGVQLALIGPARKVLWASPSLLRSRGPRLIGGDCHSVLWRREADCRTCQREEVLSTGVPHRSWIPEGRAGAAGPRRLLVQVKVGPEEILEAVIDTALSDGEQAYEVLRERVLAEGLRHVPAGVLLLDRELRIVAANPAASALLGRGEWELRGAPYPAVFPEGLYPAAEFPTAAELASHRPVEERELVLGSGVERRVVRACLAAVPGPDHGLAAAVAVLTDVTRQRSLNEALARKVGELTLLREMGLVLSRTARLDRVLRVVLAAAVHPGGLGMHAAALFLAEEDKGVLRGRLARRAPESVGPPRRGVAGHELEALAFDPPTAADRMIETLARRLAVPLGQGIHPLVLALAGASPVQIYPAGALDAAEPALGPLLERCPVVLAPLIDQGKHLGVLLGAVAPEAGLPDEDELALAAMIASTAAGAVERARLHDELSNRLEELREASARVRNLQVQVLKAERLSAIGELAAEIVHQIRNPLSVVGGFARRLARHFPEDDPRAEDVQIVLDETRRMEAILERIRQEVRVARAPAGHSLDPGELVRAVVARYRDLALERRVRLSARVEPDLPAVAGDRDTMLEVLDNLLSNAFDAVGEGGKVTVRAQRLKEAVHLVVEDNGPGISPDRLEKIFEPFFTTKVGGTGLGLPLSKRLVAQCGGTLGADSRPGEGARFRILLRPHDAAGMGPEGVPEERDDAADPDRG
jgi:hypothetical protein